MTQSAFITVRIAPHIFITGLTRTAGVMLAPTTTLQDVLYGLYNWLIAHPTETVLVSILQDQGSQTIYDRKFEEILFSTLNNELGKKFWLPAAGEVRHTTYYTPS
jgi:Mor family transcriptional regulator